MAKGWKAVEPVCGERWRRVEDRSEVEWGGEVECEVECGGEGAGKINNSSTTQLTLLLLNTFFS